ncbi:MAG: GNAT family N-acetyltransferase [Lachnospiraceae bacterium]|nr:GNAT family N-acetyltransferase [Lachnospiraceae bacterium]
MDEDREVFEIGTVSLNRPGGYAAYIPKDIAGQFASPAAGLILGIEFEGTACGALTGDVRRDPEGEMFFRILSMYIAPVSRRLGAGTLLYNALKTVLAQREDAPTMILADFYAVDRGSEALYQFFKKAGMVDAAPVEEDEPVRKELKRYTLVDTV